MPCHKLLINMLLNTKYYSWLQEWLAIFKYELQISIIYKLKLETERKFFVSSKLCHFGFPLPTALIQFSSLYPFLSLIHVFFFLFPSLPLLRLLIYHQPVAFSGFIYSFPLKHPFHFCFLPFPSFISLSQLLIYREPYAFSSNSFSPHLILSYRPFNCHTLQPIRVIYMDF